jgi:hypothetical protein
MPTGVVRLSGPDADCESVVLSIDSVLGQCGRDSTVRADVSHT